jgi:hypothetical protein
MMAEMRGYEANMRTTCSHAPYGAWDIRKKSSLCMEYGYDFLVLKTIAMTTEKANNAM